MNDFDKNVDDVLKGIFPKNEMVFVCKTPKILQDIGLEELPIMMTQKHLKTIIYKNGIYKSCNYHNLGKKTIKKIPNALATPVKVLNSKENSIVVVTNLIDKNGNNIIVAIKKSRESWINNMENKSNILASAYGKNNFNDFLKWNIKSGNLLYDIDLGIIKRSDGKLQLRPTTSNKDIISYKNINVNNINMQNEEKYSIKDPNSSYGFYIIEII